MTEHSNDGGPAFPVQALGTDGLPVYECQPGMSLLDWFAGMALTAIVADPRIVKEMGERHGFSTPEMMAELAYGIADTMIKAREAGR